MCFPDDFTAVEIKLKSQRKTALTNELTQLTSWAAAVSSNRTKWNCFPLLLPTREAHCSQCLLQTWLGGEAAAVVAKTKKKSRLTRKPRRVQAAEQVQAGVNRMFPHVAAIHGIIKHQARCWNDNSVSQYLRGRLLSCRADPLLTSRSPPDVITFNKNC